VLRDCLPLIERLTSCETPDATDMESFIPFLDVAAARHSQADLRLFAN
jgi:urease accessory protein